jgi:hypothetical protein
MQQWTPDDRVRAARRRDRASRTVAAVGVAATTGTVAATLGLAAVLPAQPGAAPAPATSVSPTVPAVPPADGPTAATTSEEQGSLALQGPDQAPRERTTRPKRAEVPRTSGS